MKLIGKLNIKKTFLNNYGKQYEEIKFLQKIYEKDWEKLADFNIEFITECCKFLKIDTKLLKSSDMNCKGKKRRFSFRYL